MADEQKRSRQKYEYYLSLTHGAFTETSGFVFGLNKGEADAIKALMVGFKSKKDELETQLEMIRRDSETNVSWTVKEITDILKSKEKTSD